MNCTRIKLAGLLIGFLALAAAAETNPGWTKVRTIPLDFKANIAGFFDGQYGLTVGYSGETHRTSDGGSQWPRTANDSWCRFGLEIVDTQVAYHCGNHAQVGKTTDGGKSWSLVKSFPGSEPRHARYLSFYGPETGWIASPTSLGATIDGGNTWTKIALPKGVGKILAISQIDALHGALFDDAGWLWQSADGTLSWTKSRVVAEEFRNYIEFVSIACLRFMDLNHFSLVFYRTGDQPGWVARQSADAGKTWQDQAIPGDFANPWLDRSAHFLTTTDTIKKELTLFQLM